MAAAMRSTLLLVGCVVAAFSCMAAEATTSTEPATSTVVDVGVNVKVAVQLDLKKCYNDVRVFVGVTAKGAVCAAGALTVLSPVKVQLVVPHLLYVELEILGRVVVKTSVVVDLRKVKLIGNVHHIVLEVVEDKKSKQLLVLCLGAELKVLDLVKLHLGLDLGFGL